MTTLFNFICSRIQNSRYWKIVKIFLLVTNVAALSIYLFVHLIFLQVSFTLRDELTTLVQLLFVASCLAILPCLLLMSIDKVELYLANTRPFKKLNYAKVGSGLVIICLVLLNVLRGFAADISKLGKPGAPIYPHKTSIKEPVTESEVYVMHISKGM